MVNIKEQLNMVAVLLQCTRSIFSSSVLSTDFGFDDKFFVRTYFRKTLIQQVLIYPLGISYQVDSVQERTFPRRRLLCYYPGYIAVAA